MSISFQYNPATFQSQLAAAQEVAKKPFRLTPEQIAAHNRGDDSAFQGYTLASSGGDSGLPSSWGEGTFALPMNYVPPDQRGGDDSFGLSGFATDFGPALADMKGGLSVMAMPLMAAGAAGALGGAGAAEAGTVSGTEGSGSLLGSAGSDTLSTQSGGGGMWDWLDNIGTDSGINPIDAGQTGANPFDAGSGIGDGGAFDMSGSEGVFDSQGNPLFNTSDGGAFDMGGSQGVFDSAGNPQYSSPTTLESLTQQAKDLAAKYGGSAASFLKGLITRGAAGGSAASKGTNGGGILDSILGDPLGAAFNSAPFLLALHEANSQSGDLNNVIGKINSDSYRKAVLDPYDLETGQGRAMMQQDQGLRGVAGSSFGDQSLNNYDYMRNLGRGDIASKANLASAGLEGQLINTRNTNRNLLLGAGLNASGRLFSPQKDPFDLSKLLGLT